MQLVEIILPKINDSLCEVVSVVGGTSLSVSLRKCSLRQSAAIDGRLCLVIQKSGRTLAKLLHQHDALFQRLPPRSNMEAHSGDKRGLEHLDEYEPKPAKHMRSLHDRMVERRLVVILEGATLETVKVGKTFELLNCDQHKGMIIKSGRDPGKIRPDITHQCLLMLMDSPLNRAGLLQVYIHTERNALIEINPQTRIPRTFNRFCGLMVQLLHKLSVRAADGPQRLLKLIKNPVSDHLPPGCPRICTSFSSGEAVGARTVVPEEGPATVVVGAFAHGAVNVDYTEKTVSISNYPLSAALTCAKMCSAFEEVWGVL